MAWLAVFPPAPCWRTDWVASWFLAEPSDRARPSWVTAPCTGPPERTPIGTLAFTGTAAPRPSEIGRIWELLEDWLATFGAQLSPQAMAWEEPAPTSAAVAASASRCRFTFTVGLLGSKVRTLAPRAAGPAGSGRGRLGAHLGPETG